jgi:hypothetical protein
MSKKESWIIIDTDTGDMLVEEDSESGVLQAFYVAKMDLAGKYEMYRREATIAHKKKGWKVTG